MTANNPSNSIPTAPAPDIKYAGYENLAYGIEAVIQKPSYPNDPTTQDSSVPRPEFQSVPFLSEEEAKDALAEFVGSKCCYGQKPIKQMKFTNLQSSNTFRYVLQTYTEGRTTSWTSEPYLGQPLMNNGMPPPLPWDIPVSPKVMFQDEVAKVEVANTAIVKRCESCFGVGSNICTGCNGAGRKRCWVCNGSGRQTGIHNPGYAGHVEVNHNDNHHDHHHHHHHHSSETSPCSHCNGIGTTSCLTCNNTGRIQCTVCQGRCSLKWFIQLTVVYKNNLEDYLKKSENLPDELLRDCQSQCTFAEQGYKLYPINHHSDPDVNRASYNLVQNHLGKFVNNKILQQRQEVFVIPVTQCCYNYNDKSCMFHVYGIDRRVYSPDYPQKCCCSIL